MFRKVRLCFLCICSIIICVLILFSIDQYSRANFNQELIRNLQNTISITQEPSSSERKDAAEVFPEQRNRVHDSVIIPDFEVLVLVSPDHNQFSSLDFYDNIYCLFQNNSTSPAKSTGVLPSSGAKIFKCIIPENLRDLKSIHPPILTTSPEDYYYLSSDESLKKKVFSWNISVCYDSFSTDEDVILFVKGVNKNHVAINKTPSEFKCLFSSGVNSSNTAITSVTSSSQEVFRCLHPTETEILGLGDEKIRVSLQVKDWVVPSIAYYTPPARNLMRPEKKLLCASTMVYNVSKFLREWVIYHSKLGIDKFIFYDNDSEDGLQNVVDGLGGDYNVDIEVIFWPWPKTQEAGFSHSAIRSRDSCTWMMYTDIDEYVFSPKWVDTLEPSADMLTSLLPSNISSLPFQKIGQVEIFCYEFGPSNQKVHPVEGVTQGYTCRRRILNRHKSIVLLDAIDTSLYNVIHHFELKDGFHGRKMSSRDAVVNHYKYQAWSEFQAKFKRRVSAYVADWTDPVNPMSKDRTPGLGFEPVEPKDWGTRFCEVEDTGLKMLTQKWFGLVSSEGHKMVWQDA
ncbi:glycosyltransferase family 92 protein At1g27200-like [Papaver somniferum]|uniref:glycosyltransferase family 92 protein At1g27200-like n=1 Tax=Papaver somniferum TaxID=3469 RepID=UPI000E70281E|nr:glycosyltransferase family 92 protein At1g27200-like [Papaver somniferum]